MILIIDGYNLLFAHTTDKSKPFNHPDKLEKLRESMIRFIESSIPKNKYQKILIVFDGKTPSGLPDWTSPSERLVRAGGQAGFMRKSSGISILFSGDEENADQLIIEKAKEHPSPRRVSVVTSDHDIMDVLKPMGYKIIRSQDFINEFLKPAIHGQDKEHSPAESKEKLHGISSEEAKKWLEIFGMDS